MFDKKKESETAPASSGLANPATQAPSSAMSGNNRSTSAATIGSSIKIKGEITGDEDLVIEGTVEGKIELNHKDVTIGQSGKVTANVDANKITIQGEVNGDITGEEKVVISKSGRVRGNIVSPRVTLEDGAKFKGSIDMDPEESHSQSSRPKAVSDNKPNAV